MGGIHYSVGVHSFQSMFGILLGMFPVPVVPLLFFALLSTHVLMSALEALSPSLLSLPNIIGRQTQVRIAIYKVKSVQQNIKRMRGTNSNVRLSNDKIDKAIKKVSFI